MASGAQDQVGPATAPSAPGGADLRRFIASRLDPIDIAQPERQFRSDLDLNPELTILADGYQPAAVLIGLVERPKGPSVILTRRADGLRRHAGQIAFPGGRSEPGEVPWQTALRESEEEVGLKSEQVSLLGLSTPFRVQTGYHITPVVGFVDASFQPQLQAAEVAEVFETPFAFLMDLANYESSMRDLLGAPRLVHAITYGDHVIWGATAAMLRALHERLWGTAHG